MINDASVAGSGLLTFAPEISERERISIIYALRFAQQAACDLYGEQAQDDWFTYFYNQLRFMGWDAEPPSSVYRPSLERQGILDAALETVGREQPRFHDLAEAGVEALTGDGEGLMLFERYARRHQHGMFQLLPCARSRLASGVEVVDMLVYHEELDMTKSSPGCFVTYAPIPHIQAQIGLIRFDTRAFEATHLPKIKARFNKPWEDGTYLRLLGSQDGNK
ncbi:hypothetical protein [Pseudomonas sp. Marseille-Q5115]|uniref:hypothetical protein n=1 Tax=Pseudomonas sp. Marseille-Q5115 TaxID=2866593 RepID=UPI001CE45199|nr:hypothetical protein [Pseudomonas sp. Marseille-Q5115]